MTALPDKNGLKLLLQAPPASCYDPRMNRVLDVSNWKRIVATNWPLLLILSGAAALRLLWVLHAQTQPVSFADPGWYYAVASNIVHGYGFTVRIISEEWAAGPGGSATTLWPPGWPFTLAAAFFVFGTGLTVAKLINVVAGVITVYLVFRMGEMLFERRVGLIGAALIAFYPNLVYWSSTLYSDVYFTMWFCLAFFLMLRTRDWQGKSSLWGSALLGLVIGVAALIRGQGLLLPLYALLLWLMTLGRAEAIKRTLVAVAAVAVVILPWTVRNVATYHAPILVSANDGFNLYVGHNPDATGRFVGPTELWAMDPGISYREREALFSREGRDLAIEYAVHHPGREVVLSLKKLFYLFVPDSDALDWANYGTSVAPDSVREGLMWFSDAYYWLLLLLGIGGVVAAWRQRAVRWLLFVFASWAAFHVVFFAEPRFHIPLLPLVALVAALALLEIQRYAFSEPEIVSKSRAKKRRRAAAGSGRR